MPHDQDGSPMDILLNPLGVVSRVNPAQLVETVLGKVAKKTGKPYKLPGFMDDSYVDLAKRELQRAGLSDTENLYDPQYVNDTGIDYICIGRPDAIVQR